jgi:hypothetical protein
LQNTKASVMLVDLLSVMCDVSVYLCACMRGQVHVGVQAFRCAW